jgi:hypothetical protein
VAEGTGVRHAGVHYPNGPADDQFYVAIPGPLLLLDSEARWHIDRFHQSGKRVIWRSMGTPPAKLGWSPGRYVDSVLRHVGEQQTSLDDGLIFGNEWNLQGERGDNADDWSHLEQRYTFLNAQIIAVAQMLRQRTRCELWYPAWSPHQHWRDHVDRWASSVDAVDVLAFHEYETLEAIQDTYRWLRSRWPDKRLACTEWNARLGGVDEMRRILEWFAQVGQDDPNFIGAWYFIGKWYPPAESWTNELDLEGHADRLALFRSPPVSTVPEPIEPEPEPVPMPATREQVIEISNRIADETGIPRLLLLACGVAESNLRADARRPSDPSQDAAYWGDVSYGPWQQTVRWSAEYLAWCDEQGHPAAAFPGADVIEAVFDHYRNTEHAARVAAAQLKRKYLPGEADGIWRALNRYNYPAGGGDPKTPANGQNYRRGIAEAQAILGEQPAPPSVGETVYESYPDPQPAGTFASAPLGVIFHGSRSGKAGNPLDNEYRGTAAYEVNNVLGLGWNATVGPGKVAVHLDARHWGHNARAASDRYIGVEIAQPTVNDALPESVPRTLADYIFDHVWSVWGELWHFPSHAELEDWGETGAEDGKSDLFPTGDERMNEFREKVYARLRERQGAAAPPAPEPPAPPAPDTRLDRARALAEQLLAVLNEPAA